MRDPILKIRQIEPGPDGKRKIEFMPKSVWDDHFPKSSKRNWEVLVPEQQKTCEPSETVRKPEPVKEEKLTALDEWEALYQDRFGDLPAEYNRKKNIDKKLMWLKGKVQTRED